MKKKLLLVLLLILISSVHAQSTWTVADDVPTPNNTTPSLPVWGEEMDKNQHNQLLYYGENLAPLVGGQITKLTFYSSTENQAWGGATAQFKLMETTTSEFSLGGVDASSATHVYTGTVAVVNSLMTIIFDTPFTYMGGNLLIDITTTTAGAWAQAYFYGRATSLFMGCRMGLPIAFYTKVTFEYYPISVQTYTITASATSGGSIDPSGIVTVGENQNKRFDFIPDANHILSKVWVDDVENATAVTNSYFIFNNVTDDHTVHAEFEPITGTSYTITASASIGGIITPNGNVAVPENEDKRFEFTPNTNYVLSKVLIDNQENLQALNAGYYIFEGVTSNHTIHAEFTSTVGTVVVADGTEINATVPVSTSYMDCEQHVQMIYLAEYLEGLMDQTITRIYFHSATAFETFGGAEGKIKIMHTNATSLASGFVTTNLATEVYSGAFKIENFLMVFEFSSLFKYTGGNLLIDVVVDQPGEPRNVIIYGASSEGLSRYSFSFEGSNYNNLHPITPKTTFEYALATSYNITATATAGGSITPSGTVTVLENQDKRFDFTSNTNYKLSKVLIDNVENADALEDGYYTFTNVTSNHTIHAEFALIEAVQDNVFQNVQVYTVNNTLYVKKVQEIPLTSIEIMDMTGRKVYHSNEVASVMNLAYAKGIYVVRLTSGNSVLNTKIVVY